MSIVRASLTPFRRPMQWPLETARGVTRVREGLLVELRGRGELRGYGEAMPLPGGRTYQLFGLAGQSLGGIYTQPADAPAPPHASQTEPSHRCFQRVARIRFHN